MILDSTAAAIIIVDRSASMFQQVCEQFEVHVEPNKSYLAFHFPMEFVEHWSTCGIKTERLADYVCQSPPGVKVIELHCDGDFYFRMRVADPVTGARYIAERN